MALLTTVRPPARDPRTPVEHELESVRVGGQLVQVCVIVRYADDGAWRGRLRFIDPESRRERETAEIFCGVSEAELWESVRELRDHHFRDLCRSLD